jgi:hypothetical protein
MSEIKIAEVIQSSTSSFIAECYELYEIPAFGSLVKTSGNSVEIYGVVAQAGTSGIEPGRRPVARGKDETTAEAVYQTSPQLLKLLRSEFTVLVVGYSNKEKIYQYLPPQPARIHGFVYSCTPDEVKQFTSSFGFLNLLANTGQEATGDEMIAAVVRETSRIHDNPHDFMVGAGKALASLLGGDYQRLRTILGRITL